MPLNGLSGKRALVTGAASGIGNAVVSRLTAAGVETIGSDIHDVHGVVVADLTDADDVERLAGKVGAIDFLINVAGGPAAPSRGNTLPDMPKNTQPFEDITEKQWAAVIASNLTTAFLVCQQFAP